MHEARAHAGACERERLAAVGRAVIEIKRVGRPVRADRPHEQSEHVDLSLLVHGLEPDDEARAVVEEPVHADGLFHAVDEDVRAVAHVTVPERAGTRGLPA